MPWILSIQEDSPIWEEVSKKCFGCGTCNYVCPTCICFNIYDTVNLDGVTGTRWRIWDSCHLKEYHRIAGDQFLLKWEEKEKNRYFCKFRKVKLQYDTIGCVGCGRCIAYCTAKINFFEILKKVKEGAIA